MILLDTHIWVWWVQGDSRLSPEHGQALAQREPEGLGVNVISCWEVAKLVELNRLTLPVPIDRWIEQALAYPSVILLNLTPRIAVESTQLPGEFHRDPADQIIVATARIHNVELMTGDSRILNYPHVRTL